MLNPTSLNSDLNVQVTDKQPFNPNSEAGTALVGGAGFQPVMSGKQFGKNLPQLPGSN
jgi:hypothetical protein